MESLLTNNQIMELIEEYMGGKSSVDLATKYKRSPSGIRYILKKHGCVLRKANEFIKLAWNKGKFAQRENILRGMGVSAQNARKTYCIRNHPLSGENLYITPDGRRQCKICNKIRAKRCKEVYHPEYTSIL